MNQSIEKLLQGYLRFYHKNRGGQTGTLRKFKTVQSPKVMVIGCSDSRVDPAIITEALPGDLFMIRNVANLIPPYEEDREHYHGVSAALEYGVKGLGVENIIVWGHSNCGGIRALMGSDETVQKFEFVSKWLDLVRPVKQKINADMPDADFECRCRCCEEASIKQGLKNLETFPWIRDRIASGALVLHGWYFDIAEHKLLEYHPETDRFEISSIHLQIHPDSA